MSYTRDDVCQALINEHGRKLAFVLNQLERWRFPFEIANLAPLHFRGSDRGVKVDSHARETRQAARWALDALREWAFWGVGPRGSGIGGENYFGRITRTWARQWARGRQDTAACLGNTIDWLYLFSNNASSEPGYEMYRVFDPPDLDLFNIYCWVFVDKWYPQNFLATTSHEVHIPSNRGLHPVFQEWADGEWGDQTHHFAGYFYHGAYRGASPWAVNNALRLTNDIDGGAFGNVRITNWPDVLLGHIAAQWGERMKDRPGYIGREVERSLKQNCGWPRMPQSPRCPTARR
mgnify:CR=1 FL=1